MTRPCIVQFGTSRFLQAHVDLFASEAMAEGQDVPPIIVVQTTGDPARAGRIGAFGRPEGYPVLIRGLGEGGARIDRTVTVTSIARGLSAARDWADLETLFVERACYVACNTGDSGYQVDPADRAPTVLDGGNPPRSFPAMLLALLHARWRAGGAPVTLFPCELVLRNGDVLRRTVVDLARAVGGEDAFLRWLEGACHWVNTLVDRIVSEPIEPVGAVTEPYALWAVEDQPGLVMPFTHAAVVMTNDLDRYERLKLHILNLGHSWLAQRWIDAGRSAGATVRQMVADPATRAALERLYGQEVVPGFAAHRLGEAASAYVAQTMPRFDNPFLDHRLSDIADNHAAKGAKRVGAFLEWVAGADEPPAMPELSSFAARTRGAAGVEPDGMQIR
ncbi:tagaturonate reductase [Sphingomonas gellani]|uniref:Tagaturonate reductase n=1 Tax=Sphingomonas gellani TaxID=1166340 RepID=A0A1H8DY23_9SPHN|nr:D-mannonate oxidoreductase [Sphingomonas gellani]SEN11448.1 tagaturonate reductase [Sphingomonas gellani]